MLADAIGWALPELRAEAEANMTSTCTFGTRGEPVTDPDTGEVTTSIVPVYSGKCRVRPATLQAQSRDLGGAETFVSDVMVAVPASVTTLRKGMVGTIDSSPDASLIGPLLEVQDVARGDHLTARRMWCLEVS